LGLNAIYVHGASVANETIVDCVTVKLMQMLNNGSAVQGIVTLNNELYVLRTNSELLEVYNAYRVHLLGTLRLKGLGVSYGMASSQTSSCIYISDWSNNTIYRVDVEDLTLIGILTLTYSHWKLDDKPLGLSVNFHDQLVVTCPLTNTIKVFTTSGKLVHTTESTDDDDQCYWQSYHTLRNKFIYLRGERSAQEMEYNGMIESLSMGTPNYYPSHVKIGINTYFTNQTVYELYMYVDLNYAWMLAQPRVTVEDSLHQLYFSIVDSVSFVKHC